jgi:hypothetical protein
MPAAAGKGGRTGMSSEMDRLQEQVAELLAALEQERKEKGKLQSALEELMQHKAAFHLPLPQQGGGSAADEGQNSVRDTARSACSGYDDHPSHRSLPPPAARPSFVPKLTDEEWAMVQRKREEEEAENAAWDAQQQQDELDPYAYPHDGEYDQGFEIPYGLPPHLQALQYGKFPGEVAHDDEEERLLLAQYHRQLEEDGDCTERSTDSQGEYMAQGYARPESRSGYYPAYGDAGGGDTERTGEGRGGGEEEEEEEEEEGDSYSASDRTMDPSDSRASSFVDSARQAEEEGL